MSDYYLVTVEPFLGSEEDTEDFGTPSWEYVVQNSFFVLHLGKRAERMTRLDMTRLLLWIPTLKHELRENGFDESFVANAATSVLHTRRVVRLRLAGRADV